MGRKDSSNSVASDVASDVDLQNDVSSEVAAATAKRKGIAALQRGEFEDAVKVFAEAVKLECSDIVADQFLELSKLRLWDSKGMPVLQLASYADAVSLADSINLAASEAKEKGNIAFKEKRFGDAATHFAEATKINPSDNISAKLFESSNMHLWETWGIPAFRCRNFKSAKQLVDKCKKIDGMSMQELKTWYVSVGFPEEQDLECVEMRELHKKFTIWQSLPLAELQIECMKKKIDVIKSLIGDDAKQSQQLAKSLLLDERMNAWEARGLEARRFGDVYIVSQLVREYGTISQMTLEQLLSKYHGEMGLPKEECITREELVGCIKKFYFWSNLPEAEILVECERLKILGVSKPEDLSEKELRDLPWKLFIQDRMNTWESRGIPVKLLGDADLVVQLLNEYHRIDQLSFAELQDWYKGLNFPLEAAVAKDEYVEVYKQLALWNLLPIDQLKKEFLRVSSPLDAGLTIGSEEEQRDHYMWKLLCHDRMELWEATGLQVKRLRDVQVAISLVKSLETIESLPHEDLKKWYESFNLPDSEDLDAEELRQLKKTVEFWRFLPISELRAECAKVKISFLSMSTGIESEDELFRKLLEQLLWNNRMSAWEAKGFPAKSFCDFHIAVNVMHGCNSLKLKSDDELKQLCSQFQVPIDIADYDRSHVLETLQNLYIWEASPTKSLEKECLERGLPISTGRQKKLVESTEDEAHRRTVLLQRLRMDMQMNKILARDSEATDPPSAHEAQEASALGQKRTLDRPDKHAGYSSNNEPATESKPISEQDEDKKSIADWYEQPDLCEIGSESSVPELLEGTAQEHLDNWYSSVAPDVD